jgi:hypothetical protein
MLYYQQQPGGVPLYQIVFPGMPGYPFSQLLTTTAAAPTTQKPHNSLVENIHDYYNNDLVYDASYYYYDNEYYSANHIRDFDADDGSKEVKEQSQPKTIEVVQKCTITT